MTRARLGEKVAAGLIKSGMKLKGRNSKINGLLLVGRQIGTGTAEHWGKTYLFQATALVPL